MTKQTRQIDDKKYLQVKQKLFNYAVGKPDHIRFTDMGFEENEDFSINHLRSIQDDLNKEIYDETKMVDCVTENELMNALIEFGVWVINEVDDDEILNSFFDRTLGRNLGLSLMIDAYEENKIDWKKGVNNE